MMASRKHALKNVMCIHIKRIRSQGGAREGAGSKRVSKAERCRAGSMRRKGFKYENTPSHHFRVQLSAKPSLTTYSTHVYCLSPPLKRKFHPASMVQ